MILTKKQDEGLSLSLKRYKDGEKYTVISGYAGSGKSTLIKFIVSALSQEGVEPDKDVAYATPTGKAAEALRKNGSPNACTIHKLLYTYKPVGENSYIRTPKDKLDYKIIVCDETSMIPQDMIDLLLSHDVYVIFCGDPFQIPPISKDNENHLLDQPHIFLDEIMRQATESEIIQLSMMIREYKSIPYMDGNEIKIIPYSQIIDGMYTWADQIIVATNKKRKAINQHMRLLLGREGGPQEGDKVICGHNYWDELSSDKNPLINGTIGYLSNIKDYTHHVSSSIRHDTKEFEILNANIKMDNEQEWYYNLNMDKKLIETGSPGCDSKLAWLMSRSKIEYRYIPKQFEYGYAITGHRAQGSQWGKVMVLEEKFPYPKEEHARWLYTCVTRPTDRLVLVR